MQNQTEVQKRAALDALDQTYEYWSGDNQKPETQHPKPNTLMKTRQWRPKPLDSCVARS